jgi:hypothetical protein
MFSNFSTCILLAFCVTVHCLDSLSLYEYCNYACVFFFHKDWTHLNYIFLIDHELYKGKANEVKYLYRVRQVKYYMIKLYGSYSYIF